MTHADGRRARPQLKSLILAALLVLLLKFPSSATTLDEILSAWSNRSLECDDLSVELKVQAVVPAGIKGVGGSVSSENVRCQYRLIGKWSGHRQEQMYLWTDQPPRNAETGEFDKRVTAEAISDGKQMVLREFAQQEYYQGTLMPPDEIFATQPALRPFVLMFRILNPLMGGFEPGRFRLTEEVGVVSDRDCRLLAITTSSGRRVLEFYVDPSLDYLVRRYSLYHPNGALWQQLDIQYRPDDQLGWAPRCYTIMTLDQEGQSEGYSEFEVIAMQVNSGLAVDDFRIDFPPGTIVTDRTQRPVVSYVVEPDGRKRSISQGERSALYSQKMKDVFPSLASGDTSRRSRRPWYRLALAASLITVTIVAYLVAMKRRRVFK
jgi:hypothetical protein